MAVSKRLRYEILRRDNHTCRYCGRSAPEVKLTVDHVVPESLGGPSEPSNLVTACDDCNSGKTSTTPDAPLVEDVKQDALRWSRALQEAARIRRRERDKALEFGDRFIELWEQYWYGTEGDENTFPLDINWRGSVENFYAAGLDMLDLDQAVRLAMGNDKVLIDDKFRYFCGACWRMVAEIQETAAQLIEAADAMPERAPVPPKPPSQPAEVSRAQAREAASRALSQARSQRWRAEGAEQA